MTRTAALDVGFNGLKGVFSGKDKLYIPNVVMKMERAETLGTNEGKPLQELHVQVTSNKLQVSGAYAVGELASRYIHADESNTKDRKGASDKTLILLLTAIALDAVKNSDDRDLEVEYILSTGLPIDEAKIDGSRKAFADKLKNGTHMVEFLTTPLYTGRSVKITFKEVFVNTEGHAAMVNLTVTDDFKLQNEYLRNQVVVMDDMGGNTTDIAVIRKGVIDSDFSTGIPLGLGPILDDIINDIFTVHRFRFKSRTELVDNITSKEQNYAYFIKSGGEVINIKDIVEKHLEPFSRDQYKQLVRACDKIVHVDTVYCVGGTAYLLKKFLERINDNQNKYNMLFAENAEESIWMIANAYDKILHMKAQQKGYQLTV